LHSAAALNYSVRWAT